MDARQLEYFVAVAEELSFTRAANRLFAAQSTVSAAVRALEVDLRTTLIDRSTRRVRLSPTGAAFLPKAKAALEAFEQARAVVREASEGLRGRVRIGTLSSLTALDLPALVGAFRARYPLVDVHVMTSASGSSGHAEDVLHGRLDVCVLGMSISDVPGLDLFPFASVPYVAILPVEHRLADSDEVALEDLAGEPFVCSARGFGNRIAVDRIYNGLGINRQIWVEVTDIRTAPAYVRAGPGVAVLPSFAIAPDSGVVAKPLRDDPLTMTLSIGVLAGKKPSPPLAALLDLSTAYAEDSGHF